MGQNYWSLFPNSLIKVSPIPTYLGLPNDLIECTYDLFSRDANLLGQFLLQRDTETAVLSKHSKVQKEMPIQLVYRYSLPYIGCKVIQRILPGEKWEFLLHGFVQIPDILDRSEPVSIVKFRIIIEILNMHPILIRLDDLTLRLRLCYHWYRPPCGPWGSNTLSARLAWRWATAFADARSSVVWSGSQYRLYSYLSSLTGHAACLCGQYTGSWIFSNKWKLPLGIRPLKSLDSLWSCCPMGTRTAKSGSCLL